MPPDDNSTNNDAIGGDVSLAELVAALPDDSSIEPEYRELFAQGITDEEKETPETGEVPAEGEDVAEVEEEAPEAEAETEETEEEKDPESGLPQSVQKRIDKLTAEKYAAREEAEALKAEVSALKARQSPPVVAVTADDPLAHINSDQDLANLEAQYRTVKRFCQLNPEGGVVKGTDAKGEVTETFISPERARELLVQAEEGLSDAIPKRREYIKQATAFSAEAKATYPQLFTTGSEDGQLAITFLKMAPWVRKFPDWQLVLGDYIQGFRARTNKAKVAAAPKKVAVPAKPIGAPKPAAGGQKVSSTQKSIRASISEKGTLTVDDVASLLQGIY